MDRMVAKRSNRTHASPNLHLLPPADSPDDAKRSELHHFLRPAFDGALTPMIQFIVEEEGLSDDELKQLRGIVERAKRRRQ